MDYEHDVFLSYNTAFPYGTWVQEHFLPFFGPYLKNALNRPVDIFVDREGILAGDAWPQRLKNALAHSRCLVAIFSPSYFHSHWCLTELAVIIHREQKLGYRTVRNPAGLVVPVVVNDGNCFPDFAKEIQCLDCKKFARVGQGFTRTERYIEFQDTLEKWVEGVAEAINKAPSWQKEWLEKEWIDDPVSRFSPPPIPKYFPSLG